MISKLIAVIFELLVPPHHSLRRSLLKLAFLPLFVVFTIVLLVLIVVGGSLYDSRLEAMVRSHLSSVHNYLDHHQSETELLISQMTKSDFLRQLLTEKNSAKRMTDALISRATTLRLDFLFITDRQGRIIASSTAAIPGIAMTDSHVLRQAITGVLASGLEPVDSKKLSALAPQLIGQLNTEPDIETTANTSNSHLQNSMLMLAAGPFPLSNDYPDSILCGGILLNNDKIFIDHIRDITFPLAPGVEQINGIVSLYLHDTIIATSLEETGEKALVGIRETAIASKVIGNGRDLVQQALLHNTLYLNAFAPIGGSDGTNIGMISVGIPASKYLNEKRFLIGGIALLLVLSMLGISIIFQRGTRNIVNRLDETINTMKAAKTNLHSNRIQFGSSEDEISRLGAQFNELLDALQAGELAQAQARQQAADEASRRRSLFDHERDGLVVINEDGSIFEANTSFRRMLGYDDNEISSLHIWDWDAQYRQHADTNIANILQASAQIYETHHFCKDGSSYNAEVSISPIEWNEKISYLLSIRDTTELRELQRQVMHSQKLESLGQLAAGIAHEINSPMQFVLSNVIFIEDALTEITDFLHTMNSHDKQDPERLIATLQEIDAEFLAQEIPAGFKDIHEGIDRIVKIVSAMKEFSHPGGKEKILTEINHTLENALIVSRNEWKYDAEVTTDFYPDLSRILCFPDQLNQVILNLIINACHAIQAKKESTANHSGLISVSTRQNDTHIVIQVTDNGCGIPEDVRYRIFDPFFTTKSVGMGTGQGLAIVHDIVVNKHGGLIDFSSQVGEGTTFTISLPRQY